MKKFVSVTLALVMTSLMSVCAFAYDPGTYSTAYAWMNQRSGPGLNYSVTGQLPQNSKVTIVKTSGNWGQMSNGSWIRLDSGYAKFLGGSSSGNSNSGGNAKIYRVRYQGTNIRSGPGLGYSVVTQVNTGNQVTVTSTSSEWGFIPALNGWLRLNGFADYVGTSGGGSSSGGSSSQAKPAQSGQADKIVSKASAHVGYLETTYSNGAFYSKFGDWYGKQVGNSSFAYEPWCAMFVSYVANEAGISRNTIPLFASCGAGVNWFKNAGRWHSRSGYTPKKGDVIFFTSDGYSPYHVGIVESVSSGKVFTIEGNVHDGSGYHYGVRRLSHSVSSSQILGYGSPNYQ